MLCVRCKSEMQKNNLRGVLVDYCGACNGVWLDEGELQALEDGMQKAEDVIRKEKRTEVLAERRRGVEVVGQCPKCQSDGVKERRMDDVLVDYCTNCRGLFFDHGELQRILENRKQGFFDRLKSQLFGA